MRRPLPALIALVLALAPLGCGADKEKRAGGPGSTSTASTSSQRPPTPATRCTRAAAPRPRPAQHLAKPNLTLDPRRSYQAVFNTTCGRFTVTLDVKRAPKTTASFAYLARQGLYDDTTFHRVVPGFVIQGGDPTGTGLGDPGYTVVEPPPRGLRYTRGVVAMTKNEIDDPGTSGSQFYVIAAPDAQLPADYALVGKVAQGQAVVDEIDRQPTDEANPDPTKRERPLHPIVVRSVTITESGPK